MQWQVRAISTDQHLGYIHTLPSASFLQCPSWGRVKTEWQTESLGWFSPPDTTMHAAGLVLYRPIPRLGRHLAYLPEGPLIAWEQPELMQAQVKALVTYLRQRQVFAVRLGPPVIARTWSAATIKTALASDRFALLDQIPADTSTASAEQVRQGLRDLGWHPCQAESHAGFHTGQPRYGFQLPLAGRSEQELLAGFSQQWRRNITRAQRSEVEVARVGADQLPIFHHLYRHTAQRDRFTPRPLSYFQRMATHLGGEDSHRWQLYLASRAGQPLAAAICVRVGLHWWYSYGASDSAGFIWRASNALQWQMIREARQAGADVYDLRGITATLAATDPLRGLLQFKLGTGGQAVEYLGEWDLPLNRMLYQGFITLMKLRARRRSTP